MGAKNKTVRFMYQWDAIPGKMLQKRGGVEGVVDFFKKGAEVGDGDETEAGLIFFNGDTQLGGFEPGKDHFILTDDEGLQGFFISFDYDLDSDETIESLSPQISVSDELIENDGLDFPDSVWVMIEPKEEE